MLNRNPPFFFLFPSPQQIFYQFTHSEVQLLALVPGSAQITFFAIIEGRTVGSAQHVALKKTPGYTSHVTVTMSSWPTLQEWQY